MPLFELTYTYDASGGNLQYQTTQQVEKAADTAAPSIELVTSGLSVVDGTITGIAIVEASDDVDPSEIFGTATAVRRLDATDSRRDAPVRRRDATDEQLDATDDGEVGDAASSAAVPDAHRPVADLSAFEASAATEALLAAVSETPGRGGLLSADLAPYRAHEHDVWLVLKHSTVLSADDGLAIEDVLEFYEKNHELIETDPTRKIGVYHAASGETIRITMVASMPEPPDTQDLPVPVTDPNATNMYRFERSKAPLVVGESTHGPGHVAAVFRNDDGDEVRSRDLAYRRWLDDLAVHYHPLGVLVDGDLYRPVLPETVDATAVSVGEPLPVQSYRDGPGKPWQFGVTRTDDALLLTQARAGPEKFDPVLKRFPIERRAIGTEPLVFSHTVSRRVWSEDPLEMHVQSQRNEGLRTQFLYETDDGWHLIQPEALEDAAEDSDGSFQATRLDGVAVRSALLRSDSPGETKATVEHEYRITPEALDACKCLYALSYHEVSEESFDALQWEVADATAYELSRDTQS